MLERTFSRVWRQVVIAAPERCHAAKAPGRAKKFNETKINFAFCFVSLSLPRISRASGSAGKKARALFLKIEIAKQTALPKIYKKTI